MASAFGMAITNLTSRVGILSRKACIRLATETGEKVLAKKGELGRNLNKEEIEQVFAEILPKACRPKVITTDKEVVECLKKSGFTEEQALAQIKSGEEMAMVAANVGNGTKKMTYWIPYERHAQMQQGPLKDYLDNLFPALAAHEMEHSLEKNCRVKDIFRRKFSKIRAAIGKLFDKNYMEKVNKRQIAVHEFEGQLQMGLGRTATLDENTCNIIVKCKPTIEAISEFLTKEEGVGLAEKLRYLMRNNYANGISKGSETRKRLKLLKLWMDMEQPAYEVTGKIERQILNLKDNEYALNEIVAKGYESAKNVAKQERKTYWKNRLLGKLKNPNIYTSDKDILRYAVNKEEKEILTNLTKDMTEKEKKEFIKVLSSFEGQPNAIKNLNRFLETVNVNGSSEWKEALQYIKGIDTELLSNPDIIQIVKENNLYLYSLGSITKASPSRIKEFAKISRRKDKNIISEEERKNGEQVAKLLNEEYKPAEYTHRYLTLSEHLDHANFKELKAFADIKMPSGAYPYSEGIMGTIAELPQKELKELLLKAQSAAKEDKFIGDEIYDTLEKLGLRNNTWNISA